MAEPKEPIVLKLKTKEGREYIAPSPTLDILLTVTEFNERYIENGGNAWLSTKDGLMEMFQLVVDLMDVDGLTVDELRKVEVSQFVQNFTLQKINEWVYQDLSDNTKKNSAPPSQTTRKSRKAKGKPS